MDRTIEQWRFKEGDEVISADDHKLGKVVGFWPDASDPTHLVVEKGLLFHHDYYVPISAVTNYDGTHVYLDATKEDVLRRGWEQAPVHRDTAATGTMVLDPVCGMPVEPSEAPAQSQYQGQVYYFCSRACKQAFDADPGRYAMADDVARPPA